MDLGNLRMAVALTSTLEALPDDTNVILEYAVRPDIDIPGHTSSAGLVHMRSTPDGKSVVLSTVEMDEARVLGDE
jgi:hypothetical protein